MTITLDYADPHFDDDTEMLAAGELEFEFELLFAQIVFRVDAADFTFGELTTLLDAAAIVRGRVDRLADGETATYESPVAWEKLSFTRTGNRVAISANHTEATATVSLAELTNVVTGFHRRVTQDLLVRYPGLTANPAAAKLLAREGQGSSVGA